MVARTVARYSWVWTLSVLACAEAASLDLSGLSIQQSDKEKAPAVTVDTDDWVVFRLIDEDARPVAGARVSRDVALDDPRLAGRQLDWSKSATSDANGLVAMRSVDIFAWWTDKTTPYILHEGRGIGAAPEIAHKSVSGRLLIVLKPVCHVHGTLTTENVPESISLTWMGTGPANLETILQYMLGLKETEYEAPQDLLQLKLPGDWVLRTNGSLHAKFLALEGILAAELGRKIRFEYHPLERNVIVATGVSRLRVPADSPEGDPVHLYATEGKPDGRGSRWSSDRTDVLFRMLSHRTKMPVVDRTDHEDPTDISYFCEHPSIWLRDSQDPQEKHRRLQLLFDRLAEQTLLHLEIRTEPLPAWCISEQSDRGAGGSTPNAPGSTQKPDEPFLFNLADSRSIAETGNVQ